jgi:RHH-type proline utilization regulon transcriptional repressor/proline dehydrogenase/delta 1-pyrroline-5-carboxylate dehydrogenase
VKKPERRRAGTRIYAPVGTHEDLLAYLVRRLLENGANTSFVNRLADDEAPIDEIIADPVEHLEAQHPRRSAISASLSIFCRDRRNSSGFLWSDPVISRTDLARWKCRS